MGRLLHPIRILHLLHRWLGIALGVVVLLWFLSGLVMLFVAYPHLDEEQRLHPLPRIPAGELQVTPLAAWQSLGRTDWPGSWAPRCRAGLCGVSFSGGTSLVGGGCQKQPQDRTPGCGAGGCTCSRLAGRRSAAGRSNRTGSMDGFASLRGLAAALPGRAGGWPGCSTCHAMAVMWCSKRLLPNVAGTGWGSVLHWVYFTPLREEATLWRQLVLWRACCSSRP